jgi:DNA-binding MarR family transcriptional regulator
MTTSADKSAHELLEVVPIVIRVIRAQMRRHRSLALTVPQFRALVFIGDNPGTSLSQVAEFVGITLPSTSTLVDGLVQRKLVTRQYATGDRRRVTLNLTARGRQDIQQAREHTQAYLAECLAALPQTQRDTVTEAMTILRRLFVPTSTL